MATAPALPVYAQAIADLAAAVIPMLGNVIAIIEGQAVVGHFVNPHHAGEYAAQIGYDAEVLVLTIPTASVPSPGVGAEISIGADDYTLRSHTPNGSGISRLVLERA